MYGMVNCKSARTKILIGVAVCNILACPASQRIAINTGVLTVLKIIATMEYEELNLGCARVIINLLEVPALHAALQREAIASILIFILKRSTGESTSTSGERQTPSLNTCTFNRFFSHLRACILTTYQGLRSSVRFVHSRV